MYFTQKRLVVIFSLLRMTVGDIVKRNLNGGPAEHEHIQLGYLGQIPRQLGYPAFVSFGFGPPASAGVTNVLLDNAFFHPLTLRQTESRPLVRSPQILFPASSGFANNVFVPPFHFKDPYVLYISSNFAKYLPFGLGAQGFYGSTGIPKAKPSGVFKYEKQ